MQWERDLGWSRTLPSLNGLFFLIFNFFFSPNDDNLFFNCIDDLFRFKKKILLLILNCMTFIGIITLNLLYWHFVISSKRSKFSEQNADYLTARHLLSCCVYVTSSLASLIRMSTRKTARRFGFWVYQDGRRRLPLPRSCILSYFSFSRFSSSLHLLL